MFVSLGWWDLRGPNDALSFESRKRRKSQGVSVVEYGLVHAVLSSVTHLDRSARAKFRDFADSRMWSGRVGPDFRVHQTSIQMNPNASIGLEWFTLVENCYIFTVKWTLYVL